MCIRDSAYTVSILADSTPPVIAYTLNGAAPGSDPTAWYTTDVALAWSCLLYTSRCV